MKSNNQNKQVSSDSSSTVILTVFFALLPLIYSYQLIETVDLPRQILITLTACSLLFIFSYKFLFKPPIILTLSPIHAFLFAFYVFALLSLVWSEDFKNSIPKLTQLTVYFVLAFIASQLPNKSIKRLFLAMYVGAAIAALIGILQAFNLSPLNLNMSTALASTFGNKNHASVYFDLIIPLALISLLTTRSYTKYLSAVTYILSLTFIILAKTKGSLLGFFAFTIIFLFLAYKNPILKTKLFQKKKIIQYTVFTFIIPLLIYSLANINFSKVTNVPTSWNKELTSKSVNIRLSWYKNAYELLKENPLIGVGYGAFRKAFVPYVSFPNPVSSVNENNGVAQLHSDPYQTILELGLLGGGLIILIFSFIMYKSLNSLLKSTNTRHNNPDYILLGTSLALLSSITHSLVDFPLQLSTSATLFWFLSGITITRFGDTVIKMVAKRKALLIGLIVLTFSFTLSVHSFNLYQRHVAASKLTYSATVSVLKNKNCIQAKNEIDQAIQLFFANELIRRRYIQIYSRCKLPNEVKLKAVEKILRYEPANPRARLTRAILYLDKKELKLAKEDFYYLTLILPLRPRAFIGLGDIATLSQNFRSARKYYKKALNLDPENKKANYMLKQVNKKGI